MQRTSIHNHHKTHALLWTAQVLLALVFLVFRIAGGLVPPI
jgi:hypothetical protein